MLIPLQMVQVEVFGEDDNPNQSRESRFDPSVEDGLLEIERDPANLAYDIERGNERRRGNVSKSESCDAHEAVERP